MSDERPPVPDLLLERLALSELPEPEATRLRARLADDTEARARLAQLQRENEDAHGTARLAADVRARAHALAPATAHRAPLLGLALVTAALAGAIVAPRLVAPPPGTVQAGTPEETRIKGLPASLSLFRKTKGGSETLGDGALCRPGDVIRVAYHAHGQAYGAILSLDGRGEVTLHLPARGTQAVRLRSGEAVLLDQAYELDDAPRFESFYLVTGAAPFELAPVREALLRAAQQGGPALPHVLPLPPGLGLEQSAVAVQKGSLR